MLTDSSTRTTRLKAKTEDVKIKGPGWAGYTDEASERKKARHKARREAAEAPREQPRATETAPPSASSQADHLGQDSHGPDNDSGSHPEYRLPDADDEIATPSRTAYSFVPDSLDSPSGIQSPQKRSRVHSPDDSSSHGRIVGKPGSKRSSYKATPQEREAEAERPNQELQALQREVHKAQEEIAALRTQNQELQHENKRLSADRRGITFRSEASQQDRPAFSPADSTHPLPTRSVNAPAESSESPTPELLSTIPETEVLSTRPRVTSACNRSSADPALNHSSTAHFAPPDSGQSSNAQQGPEETLERSPSAHVTARIPINSLLNSSP
ncbi:hypothetical protein LTS18_012418 [Coniosporium uncinatum]|uniref:Uncharacterized protein n=1 Tax=Coniosporium uncinatum TaxID=93489 RepID=A0ACC3DIZ6_9PEZI|nr:hypothetical protein LTS18_012418 [Coniosporium uncinatum]